MSSTPNNDDLKKQLKDKKRELEKLKETTDEKMRTLNNVAVMYKGIEMFDQHAAAQIPIQEKPRQQTASNSPIANALMSMLSPKENVNSPADTLAENARRLSERTTSMGGSGQSKVKSLTDNINSQLDKLMSQDSNESDIKAAYKQIKTDITQINQEMALNLKATQHINGSKLTEALDNIKKDNGYLQDLGLRIQKDAPSLNIRNDLLPSAEKVDFHALAGKITDTVNNLTSTLKNFASKLIPTAQSPTV